MDVAAKKENGDRDRYEDYLSVGKGHSMHVQTQVEQPLA
jgi:hypothetical protein